MHRRKLDLERTSCKILALCHPLDPELDTFDNEEELNDEIELLHRQNLPTKVRQRTKKDGDEELVLYVKQADRDYARYCTGWRPGM